jgi:two-component SAPR family response regulator
MPVLNGFELCKKIIELDRTVHIVFITASEEYYEQFRSQHYPELGKINYIQKPVGNEELVQIVDMIVANSIPIDVSTYYSYVSDIITATALISHHYSAIILYVTSCAKLGSTQSVPAHIKLDLN